jgi:uncharacterized protein YerC
MYDKKTIKQFILEYNFKDCHQPKINKNISTEDFFGLNNVVSTIVSNRAEDNIFFNEICSIIEKIATDKEFCVFYLIAEGKTFEEVGYTFNVTASRVRQIFDGVFNKLLIVA